GGERKHARQNLIDARLVAELQLGSQKSLTQIQVRRPHRRRSPEVERGFGKALVLELDQPQVEERVTVVRREREASSKIALGRRLVSSMQRIDPEVVQNRD